MLPFRTRSLISLFITFAVGAIFSSVVAFAWTGPTQPAPNGNVAAPVNVGTTDQIKNGTLGVNALAVFGDAILNATNAYLNFGDVTGSGGYGIRDNAGTMQFKNSGDTSWSSIATIVTNTVTTAIQNFFASGSSNTVSQIKFSDGTTQMTAQTGTDSGTLCGLATYQGLSPCAGDEYGIRSPPSYESIVTCKGVSVASSCPADYTQHILFMSSYTSCGATGLNCLTSYRCTKACFKN